MSKLNPADTGLVAEGVRALSTKSADQNAIVAYLKQHGMSDIDAQARANAVIQVKLWW